MHRQLLALALSLALVSSAMAVVQQRLFRTIDDDDDIDSDLRAEGVVAIQQHAVFVEMVLEVRQNVTTFFHFAAVVGLVKKCREVRNVFDNAVLWFNDQFLFGNKSNKTANVTPPNAMGRDPNRTHTLEDLLDPNRNNGTQRFNHATGGLEPLEVGVGPNEGGNPDRDGFIRAQDFRERWGGCFIPNGFIHAIGSDDPYGIGEIGQGNFSATQSTGVGPSSLSSAVKPGLATVAMVKSLITLDNTCAGCVFEYVTSFYITDPNNHRWIVDKFVYPVNVADLSGTNEDPTNCHVGPAQPNSTGPVSFGCGLDEDRPSDQYQFVPTALTQDAGVSPVSDRRGDERLKLTTKEPLYTVHLQVDPWSPDRQGFPDEAIWAYREDGKLRLGMPYDERITPADIDGDGVLDPPSAGATFCHEAAFVDTGKAAALEYDRYEAEVDRLRAAGDLPPGEPTKNFKWNGATAPGNGELAWAEFRRGPIGNTVECAIEYNFLIAVDFEAFDNTLPVAARGDVPQSLTGLAGAHANASTQQSGTGENEIIRRLKEHGTGGADDGDKAWQGNSHPHAPVECTKVNDPPVCPFIPPGPTSSGPFHRHDALVLDIFFHERAPFFVEQNPYWDHADPANVTEALVTTGTPIRMVNNAGDCIAADDVPDGDYRTLAIQARAFSVCDEDAVDGFHFHDGSETIPTPGQTDGPTQLKVGAGPGGVGVNTGPNGPNVP